uniref:Uncharacterized protein n=1 Tax=Haptolina brevifila TaxID=156173 RepID=A0A7S2E3V6_9EUKA
MRCPPAACLSACANARRAGTLTVPMTEEAPAPTAAFPTELSTAQLGEVWAAPTDETALELLARCLQLPDEYEEEPRSSIMLDMLFKWLDHCKLNELTAAKALTYMRVMVATHTHAIETHCSKEAGFKFFTEGLFEATKTMPLAERFSLAEVKLLTEHAMSSYLSAIKLHQLVFTEEQTVRESYLELFLQTPAKPPATADAVDPDSIMPPAPAPTSAPVPAPASAPAPAEAVPAEYAPAPAEAVPGLDDEELTAAIAATINAQVAALQSKMTAEYAAQEQQLLDRIASLEAKVS